MLKCNRRPVFSRNSDLWVRLNLLLRNKYKLMNWKNKLRRIISLFPNLKISTPLLTKYWIYITSLVVSNYSILNLEFEVFSLSFSQIILLALEIYKIFTRMVQSNQKRCFLQAKGQLQQTGILFQNFYNFYIWIKFKQIQIAVSVSVSTGNILCICHIARCYRTALKPVWGWKNLTFYIWFKIFMSETTLWKT